MNEKQRKREADRQAYAAQQASLATCLKAARQNERKERDSKAQFLDVITRSVQAAVVNHVIPAPAADKRASK